LKGDLVLERGRSLITAEIKGGSSLNHNSTVALIFPLPAPAQTQQNMSHPTDNLLAQLQNRSAAMAVIGLGYVGLPLALCLAKHFRVIGFDVSTHKITALNAGIDPVGESGDPAIAVGIAGGMAFTTDRARLNAVQFYIVAVPTPVDFAKRPDFAPLISASKTVGQSLSKGAIVVYESTVYPGATEEICIPVLEKESGLKAGVDFFFGYSPERINPGDKEHTVDKITKVVSASDAPTLEVVAGVYGAAITAGVFRAASVKVAEAAKVIENTQRDLNIALMNELALIFHRLNIDTNDVLEAAGTKWNFLKFKPGLVGGHCIGVDPYYLTHKAEEVGYHPQVILAGRRINDGMGAFIAQECVRLLALRGCLIKGARILILGFTFKEDCSDVRNTKVVDIIAELKRFGCLVTVVDPVADAHEARREYDVELVQGNPLPVCEAIIAAVAHREFKNLTMQQVRAACISGVVVDVKAIFNRDQAAAGGLSVWRV